MIRRPEICLSHVVINNYHHTFTEILALMASTMATFGTICRARRVVAHDAVDALVPGAFNVLLGHLAFTADRLRDTFTGQPFVVWQLEPLSAEVGLAAWQPAYVELLKRAAWVWDYNAGNIRRLNDWGIANTALLPFGHHPVLETIPQGVGKTIDVCFFGCLTPRRRLALQALVQAGLRVVAREKCYGEERNALIAASRIALNLHGSDGLDVLEEARVSFLLANRCFVVSEDSDHDPYDGGVVFAPYGRLVETCRYWLAAGPEARAATAARGHAALCRLPFATTLRAAWQQAGGDEGLSLTQRHSRPSMSA